MGRSGRRQCSEPNRDLLLTCFVFCCDGPDRVSLKSHVSSPGGSDEEEDLQEEDGQCKSAVAGLAAEIYSHRG